MAKVLSGFRICRARRTSFSNVVETQEIDFALALGMGLEVHAVEFGVASSIFIPSSNDGIEYSRMHLSLHVETGALEGAIDAFPADNFILNSEIIAETTLLHTAFTSSVPATSPDVDNATWLQPMSWNFNQLLGGPLVVAQNLTFRGICAQSTHTVLGAQVSIYYRYVQLSTAELAKLFTQQR